MHRSYLFAPGHNAKLLAKVFDAGADAVMLDLEDAVPPQHRRRRSGDALRALAPGRGLLRRETAFARSLGFFGKSAIHPRQLPVLHDVFTPTVYERAWAVQVLDAFESAGGEAVMLPGGEFVDVPVAERARRLLELADTLERPAPL